ncbi:hypothetical protein HRI_005253400 [Hibiscus trionum]|uniref:Uncharacterized protein n=1 Tax=Hibiscus trionum TaxID=183268 RepID=A0A9W7JLM0_HIBTR|nr:hypothetical protein HRI_005253400 [Hibiscus trionum]
MEPDDPFGSLLDECQMSSSDESAMEHCSYFGPSNSDSDAGYQNPAHSIGITMLPPPDSLEDNEIFQTPPESRSAPASSDNRMLVDLDRDTQVTRVSKRLKSLDFEAQSGVHTRSPETSDTDSEGLLEWLKNKASSPGGTPESELQNQQSHEINFQVDVLGKDIECDTEEAQNALNPTATERKRVHDQPSMSSASSREKFERVKEMLLQLEKKLEEDMSVYGLTLLEVAEAKWGSFPSRTRKS